MGYRDDSPYRNRKNITINTPEGLIDMSQTGIPLIAEDETGYTTVLNPYSGTHKFPGKRVTERPLYQKGGTDKAGYDFLFGDDDDEDYDAPVTAPSTDEVEGDNPYQRTLNVEYDSTLAMAMSINASDYGDPFTSRRAPQTQPHGVQYTQPTETSSPVGDKATYAYNFYKNKGVPDHVAAGIVGNLIQESGNFRDDVVRGERTGDNGTSFGIAQWHIGKGTDRWTPLKKYAEAQGRDYRTLDFQLDYVLHEAKQRGDYDKVAKARNSGEAANLFAKYYERPAIIDPNRARNARRLNPYQLGGLYQEIF